MGKTALVLEGGSLRCMFSAGITDVLLENGVFFDGVLGVSAGALTGCNVVSGQPGRTADINLTYTSDKRYLGLRNLILHKGIFNFDFLFGEISSTLMPFDYDRFESSPTRFTAVATDLRTGQPVYWEKGACGDIYAGIRASASMPLLSAVVEVDGVPCLDGGCSVNIPYQRALDQGYDRILVVTTREHGYQKEQLGAPLARAYARAYGRYPAFVRALLEGPRRYEKELAELDRLERAGRVFVIRPSQPVTVSRTEKDRAKLQALYDQGRAQGQESLAAVRAYLAS